MTLIQSKRTWAYRSALIAAVTALVLQQSHHLFRLAPEPVPVVIVEGHYLPVPGNRFACPTLDKAGRKYIGFVSQQADGSTKPVIPRCAYMTPQAGLV